MNWTCQYCNKDTSNVDYDYLVGADHLSCILENVKMKTKLKITNPEKINTTNLCLDGTKVQINYVGHETAINTADNKPYTFYKFCGIKNGSHTINVVFEMHTNIIDNKVQFNIWNAGKSMEFSSLTVDVIQDRDELINRMIAEVKKY